MRFGRKVMQTNEYEGSGAAGRTSNEVTNAMLRQGKA